MALGVSFAGQHDTMPGVTAYLALEDERGLKDRHIAYRQVYGVSGAQLIASVRGETDAANIANTPLGVNHHLAQQRLDSGLVLRCVVLKGARKDDDKIGG